MTGPDGGEPGKGVPGSAGSWSTMSGRRFRSEPSTRIRKEWSPARSNPTFQRSTAKVSRLSRASAGGVVRRTPPAPASSLAVGVQEQEPDLVLAVRFRGGHHQRDHQRQVRVTERERARREAADAAAEDAELLTGAGLGGVGEEGELDVGHACIVPRRATPAGALGGPEPPGREPARSRDRGRPRPPAIGTLGRRGQMVGEDASVGRPSRMRNRTNRTPAVMAKRAMLIQRIGRARSRFSVLMSFDGRSPRYSWSAASRP